MRNSDIITKRKQPLEPTQSELLTAYKELKAVRKYQRDYRNQYYQEHREEILASNRKRYRANPEAQLNRCRKWRAANADYYKQYMKDWKAKQKLIKKEKS